MKKSNLPEHERALWILKTHGPQCLKNVADELKITKEGARFHLLKLEKKGLVRADSEAEGRGRPKNIWSLTKTGQSRFPDRHADMAASLITLMRETLGESALQKVVGALQKKVLGRYQKELGNCKSLETRISKLAEIRTREGYMAEYKKDDEGYLLVENHCPLFGAAKMCSGFCGAELHIFETVLGDDVEISRDEHIIEGDRRCTYRIKG